MAARGTAESALLTRRPGGARGGRLRRPDNAPTVRSDPRRSLRRAAQWRRAMMVGNRASPPGPLSTESVERGSHTSRRRDSFSPSPRFLWRGGRGVRPGRRGGAILLVVLLMFVLLALALTTLTVVAASAASVEREYRSSQALALAEAGLALARAEAAKPAPAAATRHFAEGDAAWSRVPPGSGWEL